MNFRIILGCCVSWLTVVAAPSLSISVDKLEIGKVAPKTVANRAFQIRNSGDGELEFSVSSACSCTSVITGKTRLKPGEQTRVETRIDTEGMRGQIYRFVAIGSNDPNHPSQVIPIVGEVSTNYRLVPESLHFKDMKKGEIRQATFDIEALDGVPIQATIDRIVNSTFLDTTILPGGAKATVEVSVDSSLVPPDEWDGSRTLVLHTGNDREPTLQVPVFWNTAPLLEFSPQKAVGTTKAGKELRIPITLSHLKALPFRILGATSSSGQLRLEWKFNEKKSRHDLHLVIPAQVSVGPIYDKVKLQTDDPEQSQINLQVSVTIE